MTETRQSGNLAPANGRSPVTEERAKTEKIRIALGSNDGETMVPTHMGMAKDFYLYDLFEDGKTTFVGKRKNTSPSEKGKHGLAKKMSAVIEIFEDADVIIGRRISPNFVNIAAQTRFQPVVVKADIISEVVKLAAKSFGEIYKLVQQRRTGSTPENVPVIKEEADG